MANSLPKNAPETQAPEHPLSIQHPFFAARFHDHPLLGRLKQELTGSLGPARAHGILVRSGYSAGQSDGLAETAQQAFKTEPAFIASKRSDGTERFVLDVTDSPEALGAAAWENLPSSSPQCPLLEGYLTGLMSRLHGGTLLFIETHCRAQSAATCRFEGRTPEGWGPSAGRLLALYREENMAAELSETREQLKLTKDRYQNLFEQSSVPIFIADPETGAYLDANVAAEELTGYSQSRLLEMTVFDLSRPADHQTLAIHMKALASGGVVEDAEIGLPRAAGGERMVLLSSKILSYGGRKVVQSIMRDVTDLKFAEIKEKDLQRQLVRSERLSSIGRLAASVAHELKNPLGAIRNAIYYVRNAIQPSPLLETDPHLKEILKLVEEEIDSAVTIIGELLDFSRVVQIVPRKTNVNELMEKIPNVIHIPPTVSLIWDLDPTLPSASVDPARLSQVFSNIVANAVQAMPQGGTLTLRTRMEMQARNDDSGAAPTLAVSIDDTGVGINPAQLPKIFEPLFTTKARGTGLGLAISNNIVEKHGGVIQVASQVGKGTSFTVKLPLQAPPDTEG
jgi:PAS domain S-box-containing protein